MRFLLVRLNFALDDDNHTNHTPLEPIELLDLPMYDLNLNGRGLESFY